MHLASFASPEQAARPRPNAGTYVRALVEALPRLKGYVHVLFFSNVDQVKSFHVFPK